MRNNHSCGRAAGSGIGTPAPALALIELAPVYVLLASQERSFIDGKLLACGREGCRLIGDILGRILVNLWLRQADNGRVELFGGERLDQ